MSARDIPGWNGDITPWARKIARRIPVGGTYLEVGVLFGGSLATMGELRPDIRLIAVDPWIATPEWCADDRFSKTVASHGGDLFLTFLHQMMTHAPDVLRRTSVVRGTAKTIALNTEVDLLFIDGAHDLDNVRADLVAFAPLVVPGGIIAGHDYNEDPGADVNVAVNGFFGRAPNVEASVWWYER